MKKLFLVFAFAMLTMATNGQQSRMSLKERVKQHHPDNLSTSLRNGADYMIKFDSLCYEFGDFKHVELYTYDECDNISSKVMEFFEYGSLVEGYKQELEYDELNRCIKETEYLYDDYNGEWEKDESVERLYDANGNLLMETYMDWPYYGEKQLWTYDSEDRISVRELWKYDSYDDIWYPDVRNEYTYDANGNLILLFTKDARADGQTWVDSGKNEYLYDANNNLLRETISIWYPDVNAWQVYQDITYSYDVNDNLMCEITYSGSTGMNWKTEYAYNENNMPILIVSYSSSDQGNTWTNTAKDEYEYDQNDSLVVMIGYIGEGSTWQVNNKYMYERNGHGYVTSKTYLIAYGDDLCNYNRYLYEYDEQDRLICETRQEWSETTGTFRNFGKHVCSFDQNGNVTEISFFYDYDGEWVLEESVRNTYDLSADAESIAGLYSIYDEVFIQPLYCELFDNQSYASECVVHNKWLSVVYYSEGEERVANVYYSNSLDVNENESTTLKVYATEGTLSVENDVVTDIQVFDMLGRLVAQQNQVAQCKFNLKPGVYVVKAGNTSVKVVVK